MKKSRTESVFTVLLFGLTDLFTGRRMLRLQARRPILYWAIVLPPFVLFVIAFLVALAWWNGNLRLP